MSRIGRGGGLSLYLSKIYYDRMINCERWKDTLCVVLCIIKGTMRVKMTTKNMIVK